MHRRAQAYLHSQALQELVRKMLRKLGELEFPQLPALTYQLLLLADSDSKPQVLRALNKHFHSLLEHSSQVDPPSDLCAPPVSCSLALRLCPYVMLWSAGG